MRIIEQEMCQAVREGCDWQKSNTRVRIEAGGDCACVYLHGNLIAIKDYRTNIWHYSHCGWRTMTTRSRLNALGANIVQRNWMWYDAITGLEFVNEELDVVLAAIRQRHDQRLRQRDSNLFAA